MSATIRRSGVLRIWHDDRGFGFIAPAQGGAELFVHISAFAPDGSRPTVGERVHYELGRRDGKPQAVNVVRAAIGQPTPGRRHRAIPATEGGSWLGSLLVLLVVGCIAAFGYDWYGARQRRLALENAPPLPAAAPASGALAAGPRCDGRTTCSQMTSCAEAKWFIDHCPGTTMDGNHDGTPCEQQWCTSALAR